MKTYLPKSVSQSTILTECIDLDFWFHTAHTNAKGKIKTLKTDLDKNCVSIVFLFSSVEISGFPKKLFDLSDLYLI